MQDRKENEKRGQKNSIIIKNATFNNNKTIEEFS